MSGSHISGSFKILVLYEVAEEIHLDELHTLIGAVPRPREPHFKHPAPEYVRFERTPVTEPIDPVLLKSGERFAGRLKYYDYGVVSIELDLHFEGDWNTVIQLSSRWIGVPEVERSTIETVKRHVQKVAPTLVKMYSSWLSEDYYIICVDEARCSDGARLTATDLLRNCAGEISQIIRERQPCFPIPNKKRCCRAVYRTTLQTFWLSAGRRRWYTTMPKERYR